MAHAQRQTDGATGPLGELRELLELVRDYARQETIDPLKKAGAYLAFGLAGSLLLGLGVVFLAMAGLRALQTETGSAFTGSWSWAPYGIVIVGTLVVVGMAVAAIGGGGRK